MPRTRSSHRALNARRGVHRSKRASWHGLQLQRAKKRDELRFRIRGESGEAVARRHALPLMCGDGLIERRRPAVVQILGDEPQTPQWRSSHLAACRGAHLEIVAQGAHVVEEKVRVWVV